MKKILHYTRELMESVKLAEQLEQTNWFIASCDDELKLFRSYDLIIIDDRVKLKEVITPKLKEKLKEKAVILSDNSEVKDGFQSVDLEGLQKLINE